MLKRPLMLGEKAPLLTQAQYFLYLKPEKFQMDTLITTVILRVIF
jgi:hypothetical protein